MIKNIIFSMVFSFLCLTSVHADTGPGHKFYRGIVNIVTAPLEVPKQARAYWIKGAQITPHIIAWIGCGTVWGIVQGIKRVGSGVWDVASFPFEKPTDYEPLFKPNYFFDDWPRNPKSGR